MRTLAATVDGRMTYCACTPDQRGKGRCNHITHKNEDETEEDFCNRVEFLFSNPIIIESLEDKFKKSKDLIDGALSKFEENGVFYKFDSESELFPQRNALSEEMSCLIESEILDFDYCDYKIESIKDKKSCNISICCSSNSFLEDKQIFSSINKVLNMDDSFLKDNIDSCEYRQKQLDIIVEKLHEVKGLDKDEVRLTILKQISLDFLIMNNDRTLNNMGIIMDENGRALKMASCFDNGSCITAYKEYDDYSYNEIEEEFEICTFGCGKEDYLDLIKRNGGPLLKIKYKDLLKKIKSYECKAYPKKIVERNKAILIKNLNKYKGILFEEV